MMHPDISAWLAALDAPSVFWRNGLETHYGLDGMPNASRAMLRAALVQFRDHFGDITARVFRAPGRVNLRGMHVDTQGGYLNLMSHQREIFVVFAPCAAGRYELINASALHAPVAFETDALRSPMSRATTWEAFLAMPEARAAITPRGDWAHYLLGAALRAEYAAAGVPLMGLRACIAGNIPPGAALSSSAALCVAVYGAVYAMNGRDLSPESWILAARDAEWFAGARTGTSDQAASILCRPDEICNVTLFAEDFSLDTLRRVPFPSDLRLLVINSCTCRSLSGAEQLAYTKNRFAYSMALGVFRAAWENAGGEAAPMDRLSQIAFDDPAHRARLYDVLARIPAQATLDELRDRYNLDGIDEQYARYFGSLTDAERPQAFAMQGPLLYALSESERARKFGDWMAEGDYTAAGKAMCIGHNGDRVCDADGGPFSRALEADALRDVQRPLTELSGDYGASSPALDALVDAAITAGALGACLTGAGIAGCVIALCREGDTAKIAAVLRARLRAPDYPALARRTTALSDDELAEVVVVNRSIGGACELPWPS